MDLGEWLFACLHPGKTFLGSRIALCKLSSPVANVHFPENGRIFLSFSEKQVILHVLQNSTDMVQSTMFVKKYNRRCDGLYEE
jgi:hypothetical protein